MLNIDRLKPLEGRWPHDEVLVASAVESVKVLLTTPPGHSYYENDLQIDPADSEAIAGFAADNGLTYTQRIGDSLPAGTKHPPAWHGVRLQSTEPLYVHEVKGRMFGKDMTMYAEYDPTNAEQSHNSHAPEIITLKRRGIIRVTLPKVFPQLVLESNKNDPGFVSTTPTSIERNQKTALEGNFSEAFDFYVPSGLEVEALSVLAPNFMELLMKAAATFDVEFYGNELILTTWDPLFSPLVMQQIETALQVELEYLDRLVVSWNYQPQVLPFDQLKYTTWQGAVVKIGPLRLTPGILLLLALAFMALIGGTSVYLNHLK